MKQFTILFVALLAMIGFASATYTELTPTTSDGLDDYGGIDTWPTLAGNSSINYFEMDGAHSYILVINVTSNIAAHPTLRHITVMAGDNPPAFRSMLGNLSITSVGKGTYFIGPIESARHANSSSYCEISSKNVTAKVGVIAVPV